MEEHQYRDIWNSGEVRRLTYTISAEGEEVAKYANVYLPYGYDEQKKYPVLYLIHGGGGNANAWLDDSKIKNALDSAFTEGRCEPFLVVFPCFYNREPVRTGRVDEQAERGHVLGFMQELRQNLIPLVDQSFSTIADRSGRAIGGFSMGGVTTWFAFLNNLDQFECFMPLSGDCWQFGGLGGGKETMKTVDFLCGRITGQGFGPQDFRILAATGDQDIACPNLTPQIEEMKRRTDTFTYSDDLTQGNLHYVVKENAYHRYEDVCQYVYHFMPYLFMNLNS